MNQTYPDQYGLRGGFQPAASAAGLATRRLLVYNFGNDISTASQVVDKLFNFFSIAEFGVGSVISYRLYEQIAAKDTEKISKYMSMYKWAYRAVGVVICVLAGIGALALPWIMPGVASMARRPIPFTCSTPSPRCRAISLSPGG